MKRPVRHDAYLTLIFDKISKIGISALGWQTPFQIKSVPGIPWTDSTAKEMVFSAPVRDRCTCIWRSTEGKSKTKPSLDACLLACFCPPLLKEERFAKMGQTFQANVSR